MWAKAFGVLDRRVLTASHAVVDQLATMDWPPVVDRLLEGAEHKSCMCRAAHPPATDIAGVDIDCEGQIEEPEPRRDVGEV